MTNFSIGRPEASGRAHSLAELCAHEHTEFVRCAYLTVLGRQPDADGLAHYVGLLSQGVSKLTILRQLRFSEEAARHDPGIAGLDRALKRHRNGNRPVIGAFLRVFTRVEADNPRARRGRALMRQLDRLEARLLAIHIDCIDRIESLRTEGGGAVATATKSSRFGLMPAGQARATRW